MPLQTFFSSYTNQDLSTFSVNRNSFFFLPGSSCTRGSSEFLNESLWGFFKLTDRQGTCITCYQKSVYHTGKCANLQQGISEEWVILCMLHVKFSWLVKTRLIIYSNLLNLTCNVFCFVFFCPEDFTYLGRREAGSRSKVSGRSRIIYIS